MNKKLPAIVIYCIPLVIMIGLIPYVQDDHSLALLFILFILAVMLTKPEKYDVAALTLGIVLATIFELFFVSTGVETFTRASLFSLIPAWLPFLWGYIFVAIKRVLNLLRIPARR